jgi:hypothetical protein
MFDYDTKEKEHQNTRQSDLYHIGLERKEQQKNTKIPITRDYQFGESLLKKMVQCI